MPRIAIELCIQNEDGTKHNVVAWAPIGLEELDNQNLENPVEELWLLERLRTELDRAIRTFTRRERRRNLPPPPQAMNRDIDEFIQVEADPDFVTIATEDPVPFPEPTPIPEPLVRPNRFERKPVI
jgi:hypothetical protein